MLDDVDLDRETFQRGAILAFTIAPLHCSAGTVTNRLTPFNGAIDISVSWSDPGIYVFSQY